MIQVLLNYRLITISNYSFEGKLKTYLKLNYFQIGNLKETWKSFEIDRNQMNRSINQ